ncbi:UNVERIFIED_CONTAM: hypothetical protein GTU68_049998 [Idotea baltica]|nr:hypothetical protein [Idotea baltica]
MGNICRSPTAEGVFKSLLSKHQLSDKIDTDSAGTHAYHIGNPPDKRAQAAARSHGVDLSNLVARKVRQQDFIDFDYIIAMDNQNRDNLEDVQNQLTEPSKASLHLFMEFTDKWQNDEVPDPYYGGDNGFEEVYQMVNDASIGLLKRIESS